jgi:protein phosphatase
VSTAISPASLEISAETDVGLIRNLNEDSIATVGKLGLLVLADGMGGYKAGNVASELATRSIVEVVGDGLKKNAGDNIAALIQQAIKAANHVIFQESQQLSQRGAGSGQEQVMGSTVALLLLREGHVTIAHVGDSRIYRLRNGRLKLMTHDHSILQEQIDLGMVSARDAEASHNRHLVTRGLGLDADVNVTLGEGAAQIGDIYLLCSDGLNDMVDDADIELALNSLQANLPLAAKQLVMIANDNGGEDNISVILAKIGPEPAASGNIKAFFSRLFGR